MDSRLLTLWIIIGAVTFGTLMEEFGLLDKLIAPALLRAKTMGLLFATAVATGIGLNIFAGGQYITLINITSPILSLLYGITGFKTERMPAAEVEPNIEPH